MGKMIGKVLATEKNPSTMEEFYFWTKPKLILNPFDVVKVNHVNNSVTYGVIEEISHITDTANFLADYISNDFGEVSSQPITHRIGMNYVKARIIGNSENRAATRLQDQALGMAARVRKLVEENARVRRDQEEYQREYDALVAEHEKLSEKIQAIETQKKDKADRRRKIEVFLRRLEEQEACVGFEPYTFVALVDRVIVGRDRKLDFVFRNGMKYEYAIDG